MKKIIFIFCILFSITNNSHAIRVLLVENTKKMTIIASGPFTVIDFNDYDNAENVYYTYKGGRFGISADNMNCITFDTIQLMENLVIVPSKGTTFTTDKTGQNSYIGALKTRPAVDGFMLIEDISLEEYLYGVLPFEMSASWHIEALKSQAVAARTYAAWNLIEPEDVDFDVYSGVMSQVYKGSGNIINPNNRKTYGNVIKAVDETKDEVLTYEDKMFTTYFHAHCGGNTGPAVWKKAEDDIEPLQGSTCGACMRVETYKNKNWTYSFSNAEIQKFTSTLFTDHSKAAVAEYNRLKADSIYLGNIPQLKNMSGSITSITPIEKTDDGRTITVQFVTQKGDTATVSCQNFRMAIGPGKLKSCNLDNIKRGSDGSFTFVGRGFGHGAGLCQVGAWRLADDGKKYEQILYNYYPGSTIMSFKDIEIKSPLQDQ